MKTSKEHCYWCAGTGLVDHVDEFDKPEIRQCQCSYGRANEGRGTTDAMEAAVRAMEKAWESNR